ncbi:FMN phosphatase YigB (HAD superfamily) [Cryobacterium sp. CAN_C3]|uniref:HAD family hydrolase n=1 Tax=unclassified Cryobacterium TaxID=2649013 RepID=UPI0018C98D1B|nr:HAD family hydrolase [Cryobacterium sp. CAN_C3]MEC5153028.1 FMN phosphatase YigB (HAD superfamily) [Cryobacterium sp. CAN_C3]
MTSQQFDAVLVDLGGVLTVDPWEALLLTPTEGIADRLGLDHTVVREAGRVLWNAYAREATPEDLYWHELAEIIGAYIPPTMIAEVERNLLLATPGAQRMLAFLRGADRPWGLITNNTAFWYPKQLALLGIAPNELSWEFTSFGAGVTKGDTDPGLFEVAAAVLRPSQTLVIDDRAFNIVRARRCGFQATMYGVGDEVLLSAGWQSRGSDDVEKS